MFTGIVEELGKIKSCKQGEQGYKLVIWGESVSKDLSLGDSIAVNGVCLTVSHFHSGEVFEVDVMPETMRNTNLQELGAGSLVNLERALQPGSRMGGHFVNGHVDGNINLLYKRPEGNAIVMGFSAAPENLRYIVKKGSVAIDGVSLTVVDILSEGFSVSLVPHTLEVTTLGQKRTGQTFNLEVDILGKYVERFLENFISEKKESKEQILTTDYLLENGF